MAKKSRKRRHTASPWPVLILLTLAVTAGAFWWRYVRTPAPPPGARASRPAPVRETPRVSEPAPTPAPSKKPERPSRPEKPTPPPRPAPSAVAAPPVTPPAKPEPLPEEFSALQAAVTARFGAQAPTAWGETLPGVKTRLKTKRKVIALTFDACGRNELSQGYDEELIAYLRKEQVPATLFISGLWADRHPEIVRELGKDPLFEIENHGLRHRPCSVTGRERYGDIGTADAADVVREVEENARKLAALTGRKPRLYRAGTATYDDVGIDIVTALGYQIAGYNVLGDAGASFSAAKVEAALLAAAPGAVVLCHMNHPEGETCEGVQKAVPRLKEMGFAFVKMSAYPL